MNIAQDCLGWPILEDELRHGWGAELRKLVDFGASKAVKKEEDLGKKRFPFEHVDKRRRAS